MNDVSTRKIRVAILGYVASCKIADKAPGSSNVRKLQRKITEMIELVQRKP